MHAIDVETSYGWLSVVLECCILIFNEYCLWAVIHADHTSVGRPQEEGMMSVVASFPLEKKPRLSNQ